MDHNQGYPPQPMYPPPPGPYAPPYGNQPPMHGGYPPQFGNTTQPPPSPGYPPGYPAQPPGYPHRQGDNQQQPQTIIIQQPQVQHVYAEDRKKGKKNDAAVGCCAGLFAGMACCCVLDACGDCDVDCDGDF